MRFSSTFLAFGAAVVGALLGRGDACTCAVSEFCDYFEDSEVVVRAKVVYRSEPVNDVTYYVIDVSTIYKPETNDTYKQEYAVFTTAGDSASCGLYVEIDEEYLIHLYWFDGALTGNSCGGTQSWSSVSDEEIEDLQDGCEDLCEGECLDFQECLVYMEDTTDEEYYCSDVCDPSPCEDNEECYFLDEACLIEPCPQSAACRPIE